MNDEGPSFLFDSKLDGYLRRILAEYTETHPDLAQILSSARVFIDYATEYDNWNGGTYGHSVHFFLPPEVMGRIKIGSEPEIASTVAHALNHCASALSNETVSRVVLELEDENDPQFQQARAVSSRPRIDPVGLSIWKPGFLRMFMSHRDEFKVPARNLALALEEYGISCFVAHDTIEPMTTWQREIEKGLETMQVMMMFITEKFHDSVWTNQEVGIALGKGVPIIPVKMEHADPAGFMGTTQALRGRIDDPAETASKVYEVVAQKLGHGAALQSYLITAFLASRSWDEVKSRFGRMSAAVKEISDEEADRIATAFGDNGILHTAYYLTNTYERLKHFLERVQPWPVTIEDGVITFKRARRRRA